MAAHVTGMETVRLGIEMGGDEGKDVQRNAVDGNQRVPPLAYIRQYDRNISVELRNGIGCETTGEVSMSLLKTSRASSQRTMEKTSHASAPRSGLIRAERVIVPFQDKYACPLREGRVDRMSSIEKKKKKVESGWLPFYASTRGDRLIRLPSVIHSQT